MREGHITQTTQNRDGVRDGSVLPDLHRRLERVYRRYGLPGLVIWVHNLENDLAAEVDDIAHKVEEAAGTSSLLLGFRILDDGHAQSLGEAADIARDGERIRELYPEAFK